MKKLLSILGIVSLTTTGASNVVACGDWKQINKSETPLARNKRNINFKKELDVYQKFNKSILNFDKIKSKIISFFKDNYNNDYFITDDGLYLLKSKNNKIIKIKNINSFNIWYANFDSKNNLYFAMYSVLFGSSGGEIYVLKNGDNSVQKIIGINERVFNITVDSKDNVYFDTDNGLYTLKSGETTAILNKNIKKYGFYKKTLGFDNSDNLYFSTLNSTYMLKNNVDIPSKINNLTGDVISITVDENNNVYFCTNAGAFVLKHSETTPTKINGIKFLNKDDKVNYIWFDKKYIYIGCLYQTYILDYNYKIIKLIPSSHCLRYDKNGNIYFGSGRGIYKFNPNTMEYQKIKINKHNNLYDSDDEILNIYYINRSIYFMEYTRQSISFYKINSNDVAEKIDNFN